LGGIDGVLGHPSARERGDETDPVVRRRDRDAEEVEDGGEHVDKTRHPRDARCGHAGRAQDERHMQRAVVQKDAVLLLPVLAERLAVIAGDDDDRRRQPVSLLQRVEQSG
jgi:hypothetical protein